MQNATRVVGNTITWYYFTSPKHLAFHDLTQGKAVPRIAEQVLGLSRKFIPVRHFSISADEMNPSLENFERDCHLKVFFAGSPLDCNPPPLYVKSKWRPPYESIPMEIQNRLSRFFKRIKKLFPKKKGVSNLLPFQAKLIKWLRRHPQWIIANTDKNLGPCAIELAQYLKDAMLHLNNNKIYEIISETEALTAVRQLEDEIMNWISVARRRHVLDDHEYAYLRHHTRANSKDPFSYFYLMYKVHKKKRSNGETPTRPVCSDVASITNPIGKWVDLMLQPLAQSMETYFKDSFSFKVLTDD